MRTALLLGASGLTGSHCLQFLLQEPAYQRVIALVRRPLPFAHHKLIETVTDYDHLSTLEPRPVSDVFCALGTTIAKAGSQEAFRRVDYEFPLRAAHWALQRGASQFLLVSSVGADPRSVSFYLKVKGELEQELAALPFRAHHFFQPSLILGNRREFRLAERASAGLLQAARVLLIGRLRRFRAIPASTLASAMVATATSDRSGRFTYSYDEILDIAPFRAG